MPSLLTAFADEVSPDIDEQLASLVANRVAGLDVRSMDGVNVLDLSDADLALIRAKCSDAGIVVSSVGSPVNKVDYDPNLKPSEHEKVKRACEAAARLGTTKVRIFSPTVEGGESGAMGDEILDWLGEQRSLAAPFGVTLLHENDWKFWGAYPANARRLLSQLGGRHFRAVFDFANTVQIGCKPIEDWFPWIIPHLDTLHIKDALPDGTVVPAGQGAGEMRQVFELLLGAGWSGTYTLEPHLKAGGPYGGTTGPELFVTAVSALRETLSAAGGSI